MTPLCRLTLLIFLLPVIGCAGRKLVYSNYRSGCVDRRITWQLEMKGDRSFEMKGTNLEGYEYSSFGTWSLTEDTLVLSNRIPSHHGLLKLSYSRDHQLPDSVVIVKLLDFEQSPMSGMLLVNGRDGDTTFKEKDFLFGQKNLPSDTRSILVLVPFVSHKSLFFQVDRSMGNVITLTQTVRNPKFYELYTTRTFVLRSRMRKLNPQSDNSFLCTLKRDKDAKRLTFQAVHVNPQ